MYCNLIWMYGYIWMFTIHSPGLHIHMGGCVNVCVCVCVFVCMTVCVWERKAESSKFPLGRVTLSLSLIFSPLKVCVHLCINWKWYCRVTTFRWNTDDEFYQDWLSRTLINPRKLLIDYLALRAKHVMLLDRQDLLKRMCIFNLQYTLTRLGTNVCSK